MIDENRALALRNATAADVPVLGLLAMHVFIDTYAAAGIRADLAREALAVHGPEAFARNLADAALQVLVAERGDALLGFAETRRDAATCTVELTRLYVLPSAHRQGIASALLDAVEARERASAAAELWLTVWDGNAKARAFYAARGFAETGASNYEFEGRAYADIVCRKRLTNAAP